MKLLIVFLFCISLFASDYEEHSERHINKELSHLYLTKEQNRQMKSILKSFRKELKAYRELKKEIEEKRKDIFLKEVLDTKELNKLNHILDTKAHQIENRLLEKIHILLNRQQRKRFIHYFDDWEVE